MTFNQGMRKEGFGRVLFQMMETYFKDIYQVDKIGTAVKEDVSMLQYFTSGDKR